jgi:hypothetical protein
MTRINVSNAENRSLAWDRKISALVFAAVLIIVSVTVGCSSDNPKPVSSNNQIPITQPQVQPIPAPVAQKENKTAPKKSVVHKKPATVNYTDKTYGVTFEYPRRYAIETGDAAAELLMSNPVPMNFIQPGGVALAAVELPETGFVNTDFSSAFFNVSVHKNLTADQCNEFAVPQPKLETKAAPTTPSTEAKQDSAPKPDAPSATSTEPSATSTEMKTATEPANKLMVGDMELRGTEAVSGEGTRQSDSKYFHIYQNGACYEFALNVTTDASSEGLVKHVDRDKVFTRLAKILSTVKINPVTPEVTAEAPSPAAPATPAQ